MYESSSNILSFFVFRHLVAPSIVYVSPPPPDSHTDADTHTNKKTREPALHLCRSSSSTQRHTYTCDGTAHLEFVCG